MYLKIHKFAVFISKRDTIEFCQWTELGGGGGVAKSIIFRIFLFEIIISIIYASPKEESQSEQTSQSISNPGE